MQTMYAMVREVVSRYGQTSVCAHQFFISWHAVATLAYGGFSRTLLAVKRGLKDAIPGLIPENSGSRWPKTTLGCLREGVALSKKQVQLLRRICLKQTEELNGIAEPDRTMDIKELHLVSFHCRTLERRLISQGIGLAGKQSQDDRPPSGHVEEVAETMAQFGEEQHAKYYPELAPKGRTIDSYYRAPHIETTIVYDLLPSAPLIDRVDDFKRAVDGELPQCYAWFEPTSWHMTVRALMSAG